MKLEGVAAGRARAARATSRLSRPRHSAFIARPYRGAVHHDGGQVTTGRSAVPEYTCLDGILAGHVFSWSSAVRAGETVTVEVAEVGHGPGPDGAPEADYVLARAPFAGRPGELAFVAARGSWVCPTG